MEGPEPPLNRAVHAVGRSGSSCLINSDERGTQSRQQPIHAYHRPEAIPLVPFSSNIEGSLPTNEKDKPSDQTHRLAGDQMLFSTGTIH